MKAARWIGAGALLAWPLLAASVSARPDPVQGADPLKAISDPELARSDFIEHCGGCHGPDGRSAPAALPELRGRVGWLMCTPASRAYLVRLPNIAHSRITDNAELADMLNYMIFVVGGTSAPVGTQPFTAEEVTRERGHPLVSGSLTAERARHVSEAIRQCHAPVSLRLNFPGEGKRG